LLIPVEEYQRAVVIAGFKNVIINNTDKFLELIAKAKQQDVEIQAFNAELVATWQHLYFAVLNALKAFKNEENISKNLAMETLLYASAQHQIRKATEILGVRPDTPRIAILIIGEKPETVKSALMTISNQLRRKNDETVLELTREKAANLQTLFGISDNELKTVAKGQRLDEALVDLIIERMALLATER
jgi:tRNA threonylcarbamoyladenosine modification (KEOPS) complex Cgi121 subunit